MRSLKIIPFALIFVLCCLIQTGFAAKKSYRLSSPDKKILMKIDVTDQVMVSIQYSGKPLVLPSPIAMIVNNGTVLGKNPISALKSF